MTLSPPAFLSDRLDACTVHSFAWLLYCHRACDDQSAGVCMVLVLARWSAQHRQGLLAADPTWGPHSAFATPSQRSYLSYQRV